MLGLCGRAWGEEGGEGRQTISQICFSSIYFYLLSIYRMFSFSFTPVFLLSSVISYLLLSCIFLLSFYLYRTSFSFLSYFVSYFYLLFPLLFRIFFYLVRFFSSSSFFTIYFLSFPIFINFHIANFSLLSSFFSFFP